MRDDPLSQSDGIVDRAIHALAGTPVPDGPPAEVMESIIAGAASPASGARPARLSRWFSVVSRYRRVAAVIIVLLGIAALGVASTQAGRDLIRWVFTRVQPVQVIVGKGEQAEDGSFSVWGVIKGPTTQSVESEEAENIEAMMTEIASIRRAGGGRLEGLMEDPGIDPGEAMHTACQIEYTLQSGRTQIVGESLPRGKQALNMRIDEIVKLRDAGAGQVISQEPFHIGLGRYTIRFTLADGKAVDLVTNYPPGTRQEREAIFTETRQLKKERRFAVLDARAGPEGDVWGTLQYTLSDGRVVGIAEKVPAEALTPDGQHVVVPDIAPAADRQDTDVAR